MEYDKINNLLDSENENLSKFVTRNYVKVNSLSNTYNENESIRFKTPITNLKSGFTREIICNKYRAQMTTRIINHNLNILIDPTFTNVNRLFVLAYETVDDRQSFSQFYLPRVIVKDFNVIIDKLAFFDLPIKLKKNHMKKL